MLSLPISVPQKLNLDSFGLSNHCTVQVITSELLNGGMKDHHLVIMSSPSLMCIPAMPSHINCLSPTLVHFPWSLIDSGSLGEDPRMKVSRVITPTNPSTMRCTEFAWPFDPFDLSALPSFPSFPSPVPDAFAKPPGFENASAADLTSLRITQHSGAKKRWRV